MNRKPIVCVLMSTYNGEKYLREQLDSIFSQEEVEVKLVVRDDGSSDRTIDILNQYDIGQIIKGHNIGCEDSFKELLYLPIDADYYAFSDQDDVWHPRKLISAINNIKKYGVGLSVCNLMVSDENMNQQEPMFNPIEIERLNYKFKELILGNLHGCTQVWTKKLHNILQSYYVPDSVIHDVFVNTLANMVSATHIDPQCYIYYRIHNNNTSGKAKNTLQKIKRGFTKYILPQKPTNNTLCFQLLNGYSNYINLKDKRYEYIILISKYNNNIKSKIKLLFSKYLFNYDFLRRGLIRICIVINKF